MMDIYCKKTNYSQLLSESIYFRPFERKDRNAVFMLLNFLPRLYPKGGLWLDRRLSDVLLNKASCTLIDSSNGILGLTIETPKGKGNIKLSTIYIHHLARKNNLGSKLLKFRISEWNRNNIRNSHVTVDAKRYDNLKPLLLKNGFSYSCTELNRYGVGRDEIILNWAV